MKYQDSKQDYEGSGDDINKDENNSFARRFQQLLKGKNNVNLNSQISQ